MSEIYAFDFDDTLLWAKPWQEEAELDADGYVLKGGNSPALNNALELINKIDDPEIKIKINKPSKEYSNWFYFSIEKNGVPLLHKELVLEFGMPTILSASINSHHGEAVILNDDLFYRDINSIGAYGINEKMSDLYLNNAHQAIILTARKDMPGMNQAIHRALEKHLTSPLKVYTRPLSHKNPAAFKGKILLELAADWKTVHFYDDDHDYLEGAKKVVESSHFKERVIFNLVDKSHKPYKKDFYNGTSLYELSR